jgi:hypothetical protein
VSTHNKKERKGRHKIQKERKIAMSTVYIYVLPQTHRLKGIYRRRNTERLGDAQRRVRGTKKHLEFKTQTCPNN